MIFERIKTLKMGICWLQWRNVKIYKSVMGLGYFFAEPGAHYTRNHLLASSFEETLRESMIMALTEAMINNG